MRRWLRWASSTLFTCGSSLLDWLGNLFSGLVGHPLVVSPSGHASGPETVARAVTPVLPADPIEDGPG
jgi:hypothetical protein